MNADHINPFIQGSQEILHSVCGEMLELGKLFVKQNEYKSEEVSVGIRILGELKGEVVYAMNEVTACYIASKMMFGMPVPVLDDMSKSAISELANMISGHVATVFSGKGVKIDITPPNCVVNAVSSDFPSMTAGSKVICVPLRFPNGFLFEVDLLLGD